MVPVFRTTGSSGRPTRSVVIDGADDDEIERKFDAASEVKVALEASCESATVAELARLATAFHPNQFRLETAADRELGGAVTKNAALEGPRAA